MSLFRYVKLLNNKIFPSLGELVKNAFETAAILLCKQRGTSLSKN